MICLLTADFQTPTAPALSGITPWYWRVETPRNKMSRIRALSRG